MHTLTQDYIKDYSMDWCRRGNSITN